MDPRATVPEAASWAVAPVPMAVILTVPPDPLKSSPAIELLNDPIASVPGPAKLPSVTVEFTGMALVIPRDSVPLLLMKVGPTYVFEPESVVSPCETIRSEFALVPVIGPVTVMPFAPPCSVSFVPFFASVPESVRGPLPAFWIVSEPLPSAKTFFESVPAAPVYCRMPEDVAATPRFTVLPVPSDWAAVPEATAAIASVPFWTFVAPPYVLAADMVKVPVPALVSEPAPDIVPE